MAGSHSAPPAVSGLRGRSQSRGGWAGRQSPQLVACAALLWAPPWAHPSWLLLRLCSVCLLPFASCCSISLTTPPSAAGPGSTSPAGPQPSLLSAGAQQRPGPLRPSPMHVCIWAPPSPGPIPSRCPLASARVSAPRVSFLGAEGRGGSAGSFPPSAGGGETLGPCCCPGSFHPSLGF